MQVIEGAGTWTLPGEGANDWVEHLRVPDMSVGIGTVLTPQNLAEAKAMGARYALSPGATPELLEAAASSDFPYIPGVATASDVMAAVTRGLSSRYVTPNHALAVGSTRTLACPRAICSETAAGK